MMLARRSLCQHAQRHDKTIHGYHQCLRLFCSCRCSNLSSSVSSGRLPIQWGHQVCQRKGHSYPAELVESQKSWNAGKNNVVLPHCSERRLRCSLCHKAMSNDKSSLYQIRSVRSVEIISRDLNSIPLPLIKLFSDVCKVFFCNTTAFQHWAIRVGEQQYELKIANGFVVLKSNIILDLDIQRWARYTVGKTDRFDDEIQGIGKSRLVNRKGIED
jgi:hypothetical protein